MHFFRIFVVIVFTFCFQAYALGADTCKFGVVDMQIFQEKSKSFQKIAMELRQKFEALQRETDKEKKELLKVEEEFKKQSLMLNLDAKEDRKIDLERKRRRYKFMYDESLQEMKDAELKTRRKVGKEIEKVVEEIGKKEGYVMILERRIVGLLYYDNAIDITDDVVKTYDMMMQ